jgi:hypothetical protein
MRVRWIKQKRGGESDYENDGRLADDDEIEEKKEITLVQEHEKLTRSLSLPGEYIKDRTQHSFFFQSRHWVMTRSSRDFKGTVACRHVAWQLLMKYATVQQPLLGNGSANTWQQ